MSETAVVSRRKGGRVARQAMRAAPLTADKRAIGPGLESGSFKVLNDLQIKRIHTAVLDVLENIGLADAIPSCIEVVTAAGGVLKDNGRLTFPRALVEDTIAKANRNVVLYGQSPQHDMDISGSRTYFGTAGAAVHMVDAVTGEYRESTTQDLYDIARMVDKLENIHFFQRAVVCRDLADPFDMDFNTCYASVSGTTKHVGTSWVDPMHLEKSFEMLHLIAGGEKKWRERPFVSMSNCFVVPPLKFAEDACRCLEVGVRGGMPILLLAAGQAGATSPASLAGSVVQEVAEVLAGLCYVNAIEPGAPAIFGTWPFVSDLRTGAMSGGSGEQALLVAACAQMGRFYDLPTGVPSGMCDSKVPDYQAGAEKGYNHAITGNSGTNLVYESAGMHASLLGMCMESLVLDNDTIGSVLRTVKGIEVSEDTLSVEAIRQVCEEGPGHYLGSDQTLSVMQSEYFYPDTGERSSPNEWVEKGRPTALMKAMEIVRETMAGHYPRHISDELDREIRQKFNIKLPREQMTP
ncbi:trimethylamine methyltransferase family protein [Kiloniella laminariae]|uniref:Methyltransferase n=1 Tax=Kiloniella laminariae TaxID=454162 RepID=A0ABT4LG57_9PROT|nr:trimethylamine methyltransferase family protein [Kiloniella laminariae]MCZ4280078.1 trimethylamine methyltransferase family protein [Kiloniella laminariae]